MSSAGAEPARIYLKPGDIYFSMRPSVVTTVLGSCVSVTMFSAGHGCGAICHAVLPEGKDPGDTCRYVDSAIKRMLRSFERRGIDPLLLEVKLFGGSDVLPACPQREAGMSVGRQNIESALKVLEQQRLRVTASDLGGPRGRKIVFFTHTGEILLKRLHKMEGA